MQSLIDSHYLSLPSQGNLFLSVKFQKIDGTTRILVAAIRRKIYLVEYQYMANYMEPITREIFFACIQGSEISSIDVLNRSKTADDFVVGIIVLKQSDTGISASLNLYSEYDKKPDAVVTLDTIGQSCEVLSLLFVPYKLHHAEISPHRNNGQHDYLWLLPGSDDHTIHAYKCSYEDRRHFEVAIEDYFPEFVDMDSIVLCLEVFYYNDYHKRISCVGCEYGYVRCSIVDCDRNGILQNLSTHYENPISSIQLFTSRMPENHKLKFFTHDNGTDTQEINPEVNLLVTNTVYHSEAFMDIVNHGFEKRHCLTESTLYDICLCSVIADIDFDGVNEIILGTYGEKLLLFKFCNEKWILVDKKSVPNPVYNLFYEDLTEDGVCELISVTSKGVHIYQHKLKQHILPLLHARMKRLST